MEQAKFTVYRQGDPIATGERMPSGNVSHQWYRANLIKVGEADSMEEAKRLCAAPVLEPQ